MSQNQGQRRKTGRIPWPPILVFLLLSSSIAISANSCFRKKRAAALSYRERQLIRIAATMGEEIQRWFAERRGDAALISENPLLVAGLVAYIAKRPDRPGRGSVLAWMDSLRKNYQYHSILLLDSGMNGVLASGTDSLALGSEGRRHVEAVRRAKSPQLSDLHYNPRWTEVHLDLTAPLTENGAVQGYVLMRIDPATFLFPLIRSWPGTSASAESLLIRREGEGVLFLNELRHRRGTAMKLRLPISSDELIAAAAAMGRTGFMIGRDYRGARVWAVIRPLPPMSWKLIAKIDEDEIMGPLRRDAQTIFLVALAMVAAASAVILILWQRQATRFLKRQLAAESRQRALERHYDYLTRYANDIILLSDERRRIVQANQRAEQAYGRSRDELLAMTIPDLRPAAERGKIEGQYDPSRMSEGTRFETVHVRRDGSTFPVEVSARAIEVEGRNYVQSIVRDISERRAAQKALQESEDYVRAVLNNLPIGVAVNSVDPGVTFSYMNDNFPRIYRTTREELAGPDAFWQAVYPDEGFRKEIRQRVLADCASGDAERMAWSDIPISRPGAETSYIDARNVPIPGKGLMISLVWDVTARKRGEESLRRANERMRRFFEANIVGVVIATPGGEIVEANDYYLNLIGFTRSEFEQGLVNWREITPPEWLPADERALRELEQTGKCAPYEKEYVHRDGSRVPVLLIDAMLPGPEKQIAAFALDLTERKRAEEEARSALALLESIIDMSPFAMWVADAKGTVTRVNRSLCDAIRLTPEQVVGHYNVLRDANLEKQGVMPQVRAVFERLEPARFTIPWRAADAGDESLGGARDMHIDVSMFPIVGVDGKLAHVVCQWIDISELIQKEKVLRESEEKFRQVFEASNIGKSLTLLGGKVVPNRAFCDMLGYSLEELRIKTWQELTPADEIAATKQIIDSLLSGKRDAARFTKRYIRKDGSIVWGDVSVAMRRDAEGRPLHFITTVVDITDRKRAEERLRESERRLREAQEMAHLGYWIWDVKTGEVEWSEEVYRIFRLDPEKFKPRIDSILALSPWPEDNQRDRELIRRAVETRRPGSYEQRFLRPDHTVGYYYSTFQGNFGEGGELVTIVGTVYDITERKEAEERLRREQVLYSDLVNTMPTGIYRLRVRPAAAWTESNWRSQVDSQYSVEFVSERFCEILEIDAEEFKANPAIVPDRVHPDERAEFAERNAQAIAAMSPFSWEGQMVLPAKGMIWVRFESIPRRLDGGETIWTGIVTDISEAKRAETTLLESEERFRSLYENAAIGIYRTTVSGSIRMANPALVHMLGYATFEDLARRNLEDEQSFVGSTRAKFLNQIERDGQITGRESAWKRLDGSTIYIRESARAIRDNGGKIRYIDGTVEDVSAKHLAEEELLRLNQELELRVNQRTAQLAAINQELESFSYSVSHDLRSPLRAIDGFTRILSEEYEARLDAEGKRILGVIVDNTRKMTQLIEDLLSFSRLGRTRMHPASVDMEKMAREAFIELAGEEAGAIRFQVGELAPAFGDPPLLRQVWINLLSNAIKFTAKNKVRKIEVSSRTEGGQTVYSIKDNGAGFDMRYADKLFGVFQRLHRSTEFPGTGIGLSLVQRVMSRHGGRAWAEGEVGKGATFCFALPDREGK